MAAVGGRDAGAQTPAPVLDSAVVVANSVTLTFSATLDATSPPSNSDFTLTVGGVEATLADSPAIATATVTLTLTAAATAADEVTVAYSGTALQDTADTPVAVAAFTAQAVANRTPPVSSTATVDGATLTIDFDVALDDSLSPAAEAFFAEVSLLSRAVTGASMSDGDLTLTLSTPVQAGQLVTVSYEPPVSNPLRSGSAAVGAFEYVMATNSTSAVAPTLSSAVVNDRFLTLTYSEALDAGSPPLGSAFSVTVDGTAVEVAATQVDGERLKLILEVPARAGEAVSVQYSVPGEASVRRPIQDLGGTEAAGFMRSATNSTAVPVPELWEARAGGDRVTLTYSRQLDGSSVPAVSAFEVQVGGVSSTVSSVAIEGRSVILGLGAQIGSGEPVSVGYTPGASPVQDDAGSAAAALDGHAAVDASDPIVSLVRLGAPEADRFTRRMYPEFHPDTLHYALRCHDDDTLTLEVAAQHPRSKITIDGQSFAATGFDYIAEGLGEHDDVVLTLSDGTATRTYVVHCVPSDFPRLVVETGPEAADALTTFIATAAGGERTRYHIGLVDNDGVPRRHLTSTKGFRRFRTHPDGAYPYSVMYQSGNVQRRTSLDGRTFTALVLDEHFMQVDTATTTTDIKHTGVHDLVIRPNGNYVLLAYESALRNFSSLSDSDGNSYSSNEPTEDSILQIVDGDGRQVWRWNSFDHMAIEDCYAHRFPEDYSHVNTVFVADDGDLVASFRGCSQVFRIDGDDGSVVWKVGRSNRSTQSWTGNLLAIVDDPYGEFCGQHAASLTSEGNLLLFDNGAACQLDDATRTETRPSRRVSRVVEYEIDEAARTATFVRHHSYGNRFDTYTHASGHVIELDNGNWLISWGGKGNRTLFFDDDPNTRPPPPVTASEIDSETGEEVFSLSVASDGFVRSGRANRAPLEAASFESVDDTAPAVSSAQVDRDVLTVTFDEDLDPLSLPAAADFAVTVGGVAVEVAVVERVVGRSLLVRLASAVIASDAVRVSYSGTALRDAAASPNAVAAFGPVAAVNISPPGVISAAVNRAELSVKFDRAFHVGSAPPASSFSVEVDAEPVAVSGVQVGSTDLQLTLSASVQAGQVVSVSYVPPLSNPLRGVGTAPTEAFSDVQVRNVTPPRPPRLTGASVDGDLLVLRFDELLDLNSVPPAGRFAVTVNGESRAVDSVNLAATSVSLTLANAVRAGEAVRLSYSPPSSGAIVDVGGTPAGSVNNQAVENSTDRVVPALSSLTIDGASVVLGFDAMLDEGSAPSRGAFTFTVSGDGSRDVAVVEVVGDEVRIALTESVQAGQVVLVTYVRPGQGGIRDTGGTPSESFTRESLANVTVARAPELSSANVTGDVLVLGFDERLDTGASPSADSFTVVVDGARRLVASVAVGEAEVALTLDAGIVAGAQVTVGYVPQQIDPIRDIGGTAAEPFDGFAVTVLSVRQQRSSSSTPTSGGPSGSSGGGGGVVERSGAVIVANGWSAADVGAAAALSARIPGSAVVYTVADRLSVASGDLLRERLLERVVIVGGLAAVSEQAAVSIERTAEGAEVERVTGQTRVHTAAAVARRVLGAGAGAGGVTLVVVNGWSPPDIGVAAALSAGTARSAVAYTEADRLPDATKALLGEVAPARVVIIGGTATVPADVEAQIAEAAPSAVIERVAGADRVTTAASVARTVLGSPEADRERVLIVANGWSPPDVGVAAAVSARTDDSAVLYTAAGELSDSAAAVIAQYRPVRVIIVGGPTAVTPAVESAIRTALPGVLVPRYSGATRTYTAAQAAQRILARP